MLRRFGFIVVAFTAVLLSGCVGRQSYTYQMPEGKPAQKCISQCKVASNSCMQICALKNRTCRSEMQQNASERYMTYKMQRRSQGLPAKKSLDDFMRTSTCEHSCNCVPAFNTCYRACGGGVY